VNLSRDRVCIVASSLRTIGGQSVQAADLIARFKGDSIDVGFLPINPLLPGFWGKLQQIKYIRTLITWPSYVFTLFLTIPRYDVLHLFSASYLSFLLAPTPAALIGKTYGKKIILNYHSGEAEDHLQKSLRTIKLVLRFVDQVVVPSEYLKNIFQEFGIKADVIPNVVDSEAFNFQIKQLYRPQFILSRTLEPLYNVGCAIRAFRIIQDRFPDSHLTILGSGSQEQELKVLSRSLGLHGVLFVGRVERNKIAHYYCEHDIMLNASNIDNMPLSILEAFASGLPVVSTRAGGIPYLIKDRETGMLVPLNDHYALANCALELLDNQALALSIAKNAYEEAIHKYSWNVIRNQWLKVYRAS
jgi:glycosyltransferase involved in cell wall biosynthesis